MHELIAVSPLDGRYARSVEELQLMASEQALNRNRVKVEIEWLIKLSQTPGISELPVISPEKQIALRKLYQEFTIADGESIKLYEKDTNHDVKAVEYWIKDQIFGGHINLQDDMEFVHFACTSEDINNLAYGLMMQDCIKYLHIECVAIVACLRFKSQFLRDAAMLSHTHGQPASPTTMGKEMSNMLYRLDGALKQIATVSVKGKLNGAVGNFNAHYAAYPDVNWLAISEDFVTKLGLDYNRNTTQIEPHDYMAEAFHAIVRFNNILIDASQDFWTYISMGYFGQKVVDIETGSSTMPHKVNPINFENAEGNLGMANAVMEHMASKLQRSRLQRDLSDSTVLRNIGVGFGYSVIAYKAFVRGIDRIEANHEAMLVGLANTPEILAEPIQTIMRRFGIQNSYEQLKQLTRGEAFTVGSPLDRMIAIRQFIDELEICDEGRQLLEALTPETYIGIAPQLAKQ